jgi:hypothetical protein
MSDTAIVASFQRLLQEFSPCFTAPSFASFLTLMSGWLLNLRRHTITETVRAAGAVGLKDITSFHRFFSRACWVPDALGLVLVRLIVEHLLSANGPVVAVVDDTLGRHTGKKIAGAAMHRDPLLSTAARVLFHWGHVWVVLGLIEAYAERWPLEVTFHECHGRLGFEDPQNRLEHAVERTAPMALWGYTLVVLWYVKWRQQTRAARVPQMPWYTSKAAPAFSDMLATLRRACWLERLSVPCHHVPTLRKVIRPILEYVAA